MLDVLLVSTCDESTYCIGVVGRVDASALEEKAYARWALPGAITKGVHQFLKRGRSLDLEKDLVVVVGDFNVEVLARSRRFRLLRGRATAV